MKEITRLIAAIFLCHISLTFAASEQRHIGITVENATSHKFIIANNANQYSLPVDPKSSAFVIVTEDKTKNVDDNIVHIYAFTNSKLYGDCMMLPRLSQPEQIEIMPVGRVDCHFDPSSNKVTLFTLF